MQGHAHTLKHAGKYRKTAKLYKLQEQREREEAEGESVGHTHSRTHSHTYSRSRDDARTPSQIQYVLRREEGVQLSEMKAEAAGVWRVEHQ